jgi:hypothetical protein
VLNKIPLPALGKFLDAVGQLGAKAFALGGVNASQQFLDNLVAKYTYKPDQDLTEGVAKAGGIGAIVGVVAGAGHMAVTGEHGGTSSKGVPPGAEHADNVFGAEPGSPGKPLDGEIIPPEHPSQPGGGGAAAVPHTIEGDFTHTTPSAEAAPAGGTDKAVPTAAA